MRILTAAGVVTEIVEGEYTNTPTVELPVDASPVRDVVTRIYVPFVRSLWDQITN